MADGPRVLTVFRSRLAEGAYVAGYEQRAADMLARARAMPGFIEFTWYVSENGERLSVIQFASRADHDAWARDEEHRAVQDEGRDAFYAEYRITVADVTSERAWAREGVTPSA
jgi:heme-degrading monooxygenase HmoA